MSSKRTEVVQAGKPSPPAKSESSQGGSSHEGQQVENRSDASTFTTRTTAIQSTEHAGAFTAGQLNMANRSGGVRPNTVQEVAAADGAVLPVTIQQNTRAASIRVGNHPVPTRDPSWPTPPMNLAYRLDPRDGPSHAWDEGGSGEHDKNAYSKNTKGDSDVKRR